MSSTALIFGSTGALGSAIHSQFTSAQWQVFTADRRYDGSTGQVVMPLERETLRQQLGSGGADAVIFAQGLNSNGSVLTETDDNINALFEANCLFIVRAMRELVHANAIKAGGRVVILTSLWEQFTRQEKLAYTISKAAAGGLVRSLAIDLAPPTDLGQRPTSGHYRYSDDSRQSWTREVGEGQDGFPVGFPGNSR